MGILKGEQRMDKIQQLSDYIDQSHAMVAITGAGISVAGGGVTYGQMIFSRRGLGSRRGSDASSFLPTYLETMFSYQPSFAHYALADLEAEGKLLGIITTNVDCMHTIAGSKNVAEIQGSLQVNCCESCGRHHDGYEIWNLEELPRCAAGGAGILPWPLFSDVGLWDADVEKARDWIARADLILVIGTHGNFGNVYWDCRRRDAVIVQINPGHTGFDGAASLNIREGSDDVFQKLMKVRGENG